MENRGATGNELIKELAAKARSAGIELPQDKAIEEVEGWTGMIGKEIRSAVIDNARRTRAATLDAGVDDLIHHPEVFNLPLPRKTVEDLRERISRNLAA